MNIKVNIKVNYEREGERSMKRNKDRKGTHNVHFSITASRDTHIEVGKEKAW